MLYNIKKNLVMSKKSSTFAPVIKTTQSFLYLKIINRLIPYRKKDAEKRPFSYSVCTLT